MRVRLTVIGLENIPKGPAILVGNHTDTLDVFTFPATIDAEMTAFVAHKWRFIPIFWPFMISGNIILIKRGRRHYKALDKGIEKLKNDEILFIFPEGTRGGSNYLTRGKYGTGYIAAKTNATIVPVVSIGTYKKLWDVLLPWRQRIEVKVIVGKPFKISAGDDFLNAPLDDAAKKYFQEIVESQIMPHLAELLPTDMQGLYRSSKKGVYP